MIKKPLAAVLSALLAGLSFGPEAAGAVAAEVGVKATAPVRLAPVVATPALPSLPQALPTLAAPLELGAQLPQAQLPALNAAVPAALPQAEAAQAQEPVKGFQTTLHALQSPSLVGALSQNAGGEASAETAREDFSLHVLAERAAPASRVDVMATAGAARPVLSKPARAQARSAAFPAVAAGVLGSVGAGLKAVALVAAPAAGLSVGAHALLGAVAVAASVASLAVAVPAGLLAARAVFEAGQYAVAVWRGRKVSDEQFRRFVEGEVLAGRLDGGVARLIRIYRPERSGWGLGLGWHASGTIALRPELAATPALFRSVLAHEFKHYQELKARGPPAKSLLGGLWNAARSEITARAVELKSTKALKDAKLPALERALHEAQLSLNLSEPYDMLVVNAGSSELKDPEVYRSLSSGRARVESVATQTPQDVLSDPAKSRRYKAVVLDAPGLLAPGEGTAEARRLERALKQLDSLYLLATRRIPATDEAFRAGVEMGRYKELSGMAQRLSRGSTKEIRELEKQVKDFWHQIASTRLKGVPVADFIENLYGGLQDKGMAFVAFGPQDSGVTTWERLLRYWEAADGGEFRTVRVDLEDGGHIMILRKVESRVGLWLRPMNHGHIDVSVPDANGSEQNRDKAKAALLGAGFGEELAKFDEWGVQIRDIFGSDAGRQEIYVTIPRRNAAAIRKFVAGSSVLVGHSETNFMPQLTDSSRIQNVPAAWKLGITGEGGVIEWIDTGADAGHEDFGGRLDRVDVVHEGPEDWIGHGTHVAGISISGNSLYTGMAKAAKGIMAKVFGRETPGASDGDIMGAGTIGLQRGVDVISLSLGSRGSSSDNLARFFSQLTLQKNGKGEYAIVVASAGNSGPFDETLSQPSAGEHVISVAAAAKSEDDGVPEVAFFSSVGPDRPQDYAIDRVRLKPDITAIGGDVITDPGDPNVYKKGVFSAKSKDMAATPSDLADKKHTGMSGTSMAAPMVAGIALLVKLALKAARAVRDFVLEHLPLTVKAILMRTADDMKVPVWFQGAGLVNAGAAVRLALSAVADSVRFRVAKVPGLSRLAPQAGADSWAWIARLKSLMDLEDKVYQAAEIAKTEAQARFEDSGAEQDPETPAEGKQAVGEKVSAEIRKKFAAAREDALPEVVAALKDPVWLVRQRAALILFNFASPKAAAVLAEAAVKDEDARVRQMALLALGETPGVSADMLKDAATDPRWDVSLYAAYVLGRRGDAAALTTLSRYAGHQDKWARHSATWLLGQLGSKVLAAQAETLSTKVADLGERGNIRHLAAASLFNIARNNPAAVTDKVILDLLSASGAQNLGLTRTISKFFPEALQDRGIQGRLRAEPLRSAVTDFILRNRSSTQRPGALGEMVSLLARTLDIPLDVPTPLPDPGGLGVPGVDPAMGALDLIVAAPNAAASLGEDLLARYGATLKTALPLSGALWLRVPEHKLFAFSLEMRRLGFTARASRPFYPAATASQRSAGAPGSDYDLSALLPGLPDGADLSLVRVKASGGVSEAAVMAALEDIFGRLKDPLKSPSVVLLALSSAPAAKAGGALERLLNRLMLANVGVVIPAGNGGPGDATLGAPASAGLPVVVAAASEEGGLQFYSGRGTAEVPGVTWTDLVANADLAGLAKALAEAATVAPPARSFGTASAAEKSAEKVAELARTVAQALSAKGSALPDGYFFQLVSLIKQTLTGMPANKVQEVGAGLYADQAKAAALVEEKLKDPVKFAKDSSELIEQARRRVEPGLMSGEAGLTFWDRLKDPFKRSVHAVRPAVPLVGPAVTGAVHDLVQRPPYDPRNN